MNMADGPDLVTARIRGLQGIYAEAHAALQNWAAWAMDCRGVLASGIKPPATHKDYRAGDYDEPDIDENALRKNHVVFERGEPPEREPYDQLAAETMNDRITKPGGLPEYVRIALGVAYCNHGGVPEYQWPQRAGTTLDGFCERLEQALKFAGRFV